MKKLSTKIMRVPEARAKKHKSRMLRLATAGRSFEIMMRGKPSVFLLALDENGNDVRYTANHPSKP